MVIVNTNTDGWERSYFFIYFIEKQSLQGFPWSSSGIQYRIKTEEDFKKSKHVGITPIKV